MRITAVTVTPIAFHDPPLLNSWGVHEPLALRTIVQLRTDDGVVGLGECGGGELLLSNVAAAANAVIGLQVCDLQQMEQAVRAALPAANERQVLAAYSPLEVAALDALGHTWGVPVHDLLGGRVRESVEFAGYLFYKWAGHPTRTDGGQWLFAPDRWGAALDPDGIVEQAQDMARRYGFTSFKLKGGVFAPEDETAAVRALARSVSGGAVRIDPNTAWTVETSIAVANQLDGFIEYLEDPTPGFEGMAQVARSAPMPLATNMCVSSFEDLAPAVRAGAVAIVLVDHHTFGGLRRSQQMARICETFDLGVSMHSNSHLGISLAAMAHLGAVIPNLGHACDTHYPWNADDDIVRAGTLRFDAGFLSVPTGPGLGVEIDEAALAEAHERYVRSGRTKRDDAGYRRLIEPSFDVVLPRW